VKKLWFRWALRVWIAIASLVAFLVGWIFLGHSGKPVSAGLESANQAAEVVTLPTLAPLPDLGEENQIRPLLQQPSFQFRRPRLRTGGS